MMRKVFCLSLVLTMLFPLFGFVNVDYGAEISKTGGILEFASIKFKENTAETLGETQENFNLILNEARSSLENTLAAQLTEKVNSNTELETEKKANYLRNIIVSVRATENNVLVQINYGTVEMWQFFSGKETALEYKYSFLTYDAINTLKPRISSFQFGGAETTTPEFLYDYIGSVLLTQFGAQASEIIENPEYTYSYITSKRRVHSNADENFFHDGYWYHTWSIEDMDDSFIKLYTTHANSVVWYLISLGLTAVFMATAWLVAKYKFKNNNLKKDLKNFENNF
ncbi:MAG: hypothetical protein PHV79_01785, partial [Clostridia bacterium]|nr:hypothetical protein [Clostridia bacterium]